MPISDNLLNIMAQGQPNPLTMARGAKKDRTLIENMGLKNELLKYDLDTAAYQASPEYRAYEQDMARMEHQAKVADAMSKMKDAQLKDLKMRSERLGQAANWVLSLPEDMRTGAWDSALENVSKEIEGFDVSAYKGKWDNATGNHLKNAAVSIDDQIKNEFELRRIKNAERSTDAYIKSVGTASGNRTLKEAKEDRESKKRAKQDAFLQELGAVNGKAEDQWTREDYDRKIRDATLAGVDDVAKDLRDRRDYRYPKEDYPYGTSGYNEEPPAPNIVKRYK